MTNIYYSNITYNCNNRCKNCISNSVRQHKNSVLSISDLKKAVADLSIENTDIWNINGGEPTLNPDLSNIINFCYSTTHNIILYTNGRNLSSLEDSTINMIERIIVPIYGDCDFHNAYVRSNLAFQETVDSISQVVNKYPNKCDIKIFIHDKNQLYNLMRDSIWDVLRKNQHFSVTRVLNGYKDLIPPSFEITGLAETLIKELYNGGKIVRFYDFPFCHFSEDFKNYLYSIFDSSFNFNPLVTCINKKGEIKKSFYRVETEYFSKCKGCHLKDFCTMIMRNYFCPVIKNGRCYISTE